MEVVLSERKGSVLRVTLNRPEIKNAMNEVVFEELRRLFSSDLDGLRAIVIKGAGDFFCAGGDLNWMKSALTKMPQENEEDALLLARMVRAIDECPIPVIAVVRGGAFGGGVGVVAASDIVIADDQSVFSLSEIKLGLIPATIGPLVMRKIGVSQMRRLSLTGKRFGAEEAKRIGLVHEVVPVSSMQSVLNDYLVELSTSAPHAVKVGKKLIRDLQGERLWKEDISETTSRILSEIRIGPEAQEGMKAFLEKKPQPWKKPIQE